MAINLRDIARMCEFSFELQSLGAVRCLSLNSNCISQANKQLDSSSTHSSDFVRWLFGELARRPVDGQADEADLIDTPNLTAAELNLVTNDELEEFADKLILKNKYLLKTHKSNDIQRSRDESANDFLVRAFIHHNAEQKAQWERMTKPLPSSLFASATMEAMQRNLGLSNQLLDTIDKHARAHSGIEQLLAEEKKKWNGMTQSIFQPLSASAEIEAMQRNHGALDQFGNAQHYLDQISASTMLSKDIYRREDMLMEAVRGLSQGENMSARIAAGLERPQQVIRDLLINHEAMFRLPQAFEATSLLVSCQVGAVAEFAQLHAKGTLDRQGFLASLTSPWVNSVEAPRSVTAMLELQGLGNALKTIKGFDLELTVALRRDLGDWRDKITFRESVFIDPVARVDFYVTRGFNTALTDFPEAAFHQSLEVAGIDGDTLNLELYGSVVYPSTDPEDEAGLQRTNKCHDWLQRFERRLRQFINDAMTIQYGSNWPKKRLAPKLYEDWEHKKQRAESNGDILPFIEFADFQDYETIICKQDHWREVFEVRFKKKESVRESLQRLQPIRVAAMHARIVTKEDELYLYAEVVRLLSAIK